MIKEAIEKAVNKINLPEAEMMAAMGEIMEGVATPAQIAALITALRMKGETVEEVTGAARIMRRKATRINACATTIVDTCGTGGDKLNTFNISTTAAFVVAAAGIVVAKHGTVPFPAAAAAPTFWKRWVLISAPTRKSWKNAYSKSVLDFFSRPSCTAR